MPLDTNIPLSVQPLKIPSAAEVMTLKDLALRSQERGLDIQTKENTLKSQNAISQIMEKYKQDPEGAVNTRSLAEIAQVPFGGMEAATRLNAFKTAQRETQVKERSEQQAEVMKDVGTIVSDARSLREQGLRPEQIRQEVNKRLLEREAENEKMGVSSVFSKGQRQNLINMWTQQPLDEMEAHYRALGGKMPEETPFTKELAAAGIRPGTPEYEKAMKAKIAKDTSPTGTMLNMTNMPDKETLNFMAKQYLTGDKSVMVGLGRSPVTINALRKEITAEAKSQGMTPAHVSVKMAEFQGALAAERTAGTREAQLGFAAHELDNFLPLAEKASDAVPRTAFKPINQLIQAGEAQWSPQQAALVAANRAVINSFAMVASRGVATVHNTEEAEKMLNTASSHEVYKATLKQLKNEVDAAMKAPKQVKKDIAEGITGNPKEEKPKPDIKSLLDKYK